MYANFEACMRDERDMRLEKRIKFEDQALFARVNITFLCNIGSY